MASPIIIFMLVLVSAFAVQTILAALAPYNFYKYYSPLWGLNHLTVNPQGSQVDLLMDKSSGAGFRSKKDYGSGRFHVRMKIPEGLTGGIVTCFYLTSLPPNQQPGNQYEVDFEFLGTNGTLQTNVYNRDQGNREQTFNLWFNPSQDFHTYEILWNSQQIVFLVDMIPIRVFKNNRAHGVDYPSLPMHIEASIWNADWAGTVDWSKAPFIAHYQDFGFQACAGDVQGCDSNKYKWNSWKMGAAKQSKMDKYRKQFMAYDYCATPQTRKPECQYNV